MSIYLAHARVVSTSANGAFFLIENVDLSLMNALRRTLLNEVTSLAFDTVRVLENTSVIGDEILAHRLGLVVLDSTKVRNMVRITDCTCEEKNCARCTVRFDLDMENTTSKVLHLFPCPSTLRACTAFAPVVVDTGALLTCLSPGQKLRCIIEAHVGSGKDNARWSPCTVVYFETAAGNCHDAWELTIETNGGSNPVALVAHALALLKENMMETSRLVCAH
jgi:DNA-directed RNA polymerase alpha subunit